MCDQGDEPAVAPTPKLTLMNTGAPRREVDRCLIRGREELFGIYGVAVGLQVEQSIVGHRWPSRIGNRSAVGRPVRPKFHALSVATPTFRSMK